MTFVTPSGVNYHSTAASCANRALTAEAQVVFLIDCHDCQHLPCLSHPQLEALRDAARGTALGDCNRWPGSRLASGKESSGSTTSGGGANEPCCTRISSRISSWLIDRMSPEPSPMTGCAPGDDGELDKRRVV